YLSRPEVISAYLVLEDALRRDDSRRELRRFLVDVALDRRYPLYAEARGHLLALGADTSDDGELEGLLARTYDAEDKFAEANTYYLRSIEHKPDRIESYVNRALLLRRANDPTLKGPKSRDPAQEADNTIAALVQKNPGNFNAHLAAAAYAQAHQTVEKVRTEVEAAEKLAPDEGRVILAVATLALNAARRLAAEPKADPVAVKAERDRARAALDRGVRLHPKDPSMYKLRADVDVAEKRLAEAETVLRTGTEEIPESVDLWWELGEVRLLRNDPAGADQALERAKDLGLPESAAAFRTAQVLALRERWPDAANTLARVRDDLAGTPYAKPANMLLARCYEQMGDLDRRIEAFGRVVADRNPNDPYWLPAMVGLAEARAALRQRDAALTLYGSIAVRYPGAWLNVAQLRLDQVAQQPAAKRDLTEFEAALDRAARAVPADTTQLILLQAARLHLKNDNPAARKLLAGLREKKPKDPDVRLALAVQAVREGDRAQAEQAVREARAELGDSVGLRLFEATFLIDPKSPTAAADLRALAPKADDKFSKPDRVRLARGLADIAAGRGQAEVAAGLLAQASADAPRDLGLLLRQFDQAMLGGEDKRIEEVLAEIRAVDLEEGTSHRLARALYLLRRARRDTKDAAARDEAGRLFDLVEAERPGWFRVTVGQALVADLQGDERRAAERYQQAVEQGERDPQVVRRAVELLAARGRSAEAQALLDKLPAEALEGTGLGRLVAEVSLFDKRPAVAAVQAAKAIDPNSTDYKDHLWLGRMYWSADAKDKAEPAFRKAVALAKGKGDPAPLLALVECLIATGRKADAEKLVPEADAVGADARAFARARIYHLLGNRAEAQKAYETARGERPEDVKVLRGYAEFLLQAGDFARAREQWQLFNTLPTASEEEKRHAGMMIVVCTNLDPKQDYRNARAALEAFGLVEKDRLKPPGETQRPDDLRAAASLLAIQVDRASRVEALKYLDRLETVLGADGKAPTAADRFLRAQLHQVLSESDKAQVQCQLALNLDKTNATYIAYYVGLIVRQQNPALLTEAEKWLGELKKLQPDAIRTAELAARLAAAQGGSDEARKVIGGLEGKPGVRSDLLARLCEELNLLAEAGRLYQAFGDEVKRPEALLPYAAFLGRRHDTEKALDRCEEARRQKCPPAALTAAGVAILYAVRTPRPSDVARVQEWVMEGLSAAANQPALTADLLNRQAALLNLQGKYDEAIAVYTRLLTLNARDAVAMNNLGYLLAAHKKDFSTALDWVAKAKTVVGPVPQLLDTEALVYLEKAKAERTEDGKRAAATLLAIQVDRASRVEALKYLDRLETVLGADGKAPTA
ncbi:MAG TPA: tetratricopeptide repeat protein, partial [Gemmataceae bacterium]|nr:tetratricopeptide repeat protein [Gemmataceae bacterium]